MELQPSTPPSNHATISRAERGAQAKAFYRAALVPLGRDLIWDTRIHYFTAGRGSLVSGAEGPFSQNPPGIPKRKIAFEMSKPSTPQPSPPWLFNNAFPPGRLTTPANYGAAFVRDPDGNNIEARVFHGPSTPLGGASVFGHGADCAGLTPQPSPHRGTAI